MLGDKEYRRLRDLARRNRDNLVDLRWMLVGRETDSPEKLARTCRVYDESEAARRGLNM